MSKRDFRSNWMLVQGTAGPSATLRSGRDDNSFFDTYIPHNQPSRCSILPQLAAGKSAARDDKGETGAPMESGCWTENRVLSSTGRRSTPAGTLANHRIDFFSLAM